MKQVVEWFFFGFFFVIGMVIIFVKAGKGGNQSGGQQTAEILNAGAFGLSNVASSLEGN